MQIGYYFRYSTFIVLFMLFYSANGVSASNTSDKIGIKNDDANKLTALGKEYYDLNDYERAKKYFFDALTIYRCNF